MSKKVLMCVMCICLWHVSDLHAFVIEKDRLLFPYGIWHSHMGLLLGLWYEDVKWGDLKHRIRVRALAGFNGGTSLYLEQYIPYPTQVGLYHRHNYTSENVYDVRHLYGSRVQSQMTLSGIYIGELGLYYQPMGNLRLTPGVVFGFAGTSSFQGRSNQIAEVAAQVNAIVGRQSFHPRDAEGFLNLRMLKLLHGNGAATFETRVGGQVPWFSPEWVVGSGLRAQWASELAEFWFFRPWLGGIHRLAAFSELAFLERTLLDGNVFLLWRVYQGLLFEWVRQVSCTVIVEAGTPLTSNPGREIWDSLGVGVLAELKNERVVQLQAAVSPSQGQYAVVFSSKQNWQ